MADSSLAAIRRYTRELTRSPDENQLSTVDLDEFINTAYLYNFPGVKALFTLRKILKFYTQPNVDVYETNDTDVNNPLYDFKNRYPVVHRPIFIAGVPAAFTSYRDEFYAAYPQTNFISDTQLRGDGTTGPFVGTLQSRPVLQNNVMFSCLNATGTAMIVVDRPVNNVTGTLNVPNSIVNLGTINYINGQFSLNFPAATAMGAIIESTVIGYAPGIPVSMLYYDTKFTLRPVPDKAYVVQMEVDARPTEILGATSEAELAQWWQYISLLTAEHIFNRRQDDEGLAKIRPELQKQEDLVGRPTLSQLAELRSKTYFTGIGSRGWGNFNNRWPY